MSNILMRRANIAELKKRYIGDKEVKRVFA